MPCGKNRVRKWDSADKDVVILHGFKRSKVMPSLSPFVLKLETYLRITGIAYEYDSENPAGPKGLTPWITFNGEDLGDSQIIIERLSSYFGKDLNSHLTASEAGVARSMAIMTDEHLIWGVIWWRLIEDPEKKFIQYGGIPAIVGKLLPIIRPFLRNKLKSQGLGRHSKEEIIAIMKKNLQALSSFLGDKDFLMGSIPCEVDCSVFGMLGQLVWALEGCPFTAELQGNLKNLANYCYRMKEKYYPDWDTCLDK